MRLDEESIERYSRQIVLAEVGPHGQIRLAESRVAVVGDGAGAARVVAHLAAAGVGWIAAAPALHAFADPAQPDLTLLTLAAAAGTPVDAAIITAASLAEAATAVASWSARADTTLWIAADRAGGTPPCPACAGAAVRPERRSSGASRLADALLGTVVATEAVKTLLTIGTTLRGRMLTWDPDTASLIDTSVAARPDCSCRRSAASA